MDHRKRPTVNKESNRQLHVKATVDMEVRRSRTPKDCHATRLTPSG